VTFRAAGSVRDRAPARRAVKRVRIGVLLLLLSAGLPSAAFAGSALSPEVRIVVLEVGTAPGTLRLGVRKRNMLSYPDPGALTQETIDPEILAFNPGACAELQSGFISSGTAGPAPYDVFDVQLEPSGRSPEEQRELLKIVLASFMTSRKVRLYVRDDLCSGSGERVVAGIVVD
jgi:hypothetical protein